LKSARLSFDCLASTPRIMCYRFAKLEPFCRPALPGPSGRKSTSSRTRRYCIASNGNCGTNFLIHSGTSSLGYVGCINDWRIPLRARTYIASCSRSSLTRRWSFTHTPAPRWAAGPLTSENGQIIRGCTSSSMTRGASSPTVLLCFRATWCSIAVARTLLARGYRIELTSGIGTCPSRLFGPKRNILSGAALTHSGFARSSPRITSKRRHVEFL